MKSFQLVVCFRLGALISQPDRIVTRHRETPSRLTERTGRALQSIAPTFEPWSWNPGALKPSRMVKKIERVGKTRLAASTSLFGLPSPPSRLGRNLSDCQRQTSQNRTCRELSFKRSEGDEAWLLQLRVFGFGLFVDGNLGVGVFPEREKVFVGGERPDAGGIGIRSLHSSRLQRIGTSYAQMRQRSRPAVPDNAAMVENLLKLGDGSAALSGCQVCL